MSEASERGKAVIEWAYDVLEDENPDVTEYGQWLGYWEGEASRAALEAYQENGQAEAVLLYLALATSTLDRVLEHLAAHS